MTDKRLLGGIFNYATKIPVEVLEVMDFESGADYWYEIIKAGLNQRLDYSREFSQEAYVTTIKLNEKMAESKNQKKVTFFTDTDPSEQQYKGGVNINSIKAVGDSYARLEEADEIECALREVEAMQKVLLYSQGVNLRVIIENALEGIPVAVSKLQEICENFTSLGKNIKILLSAGINIADKLATA